MKAKTFSIISLIAVLALLLSGPATAQGPQPPLPPERSGPLPLPPTWGPEFSKPFGPLPLGIRAAQQAQNVELVGQIGGITHAVAVEGNYAYIGVGPRLVILDVSDKAHPIVIGRTGVLPGVVSGVAVAGSYAYVAVEGGGLRIINVADPARPREVGFYDTPGWAYGVAVSGSYAYVADGAGLRIINVADPARPTEVGFYETPGVALGVAVAGNYAYVADWGGGLRIINVADPARPREVGFYDTPGNARGVVVSGSYAYVADDYEGLRIINVADPARPREVGFYETPGYAEGVAVSGSYAYVAAWDAGLRIINVADPARPTEVGFYETLGYGLGVAVVGSYAYVAAGYEGLRIINVADPAEPREVGFHEPLVCALGVAVSGNYAYVADGYAGLSIINVADPAHPREVGFYDTPGWAWGVAVSGSYAYVADGYAGLRIINVADPAHPTEVGFYDTLGDARSVAVSGSYAYVADDYEGLRIINVADPARPREVGFYETLGYAEGVAVSGSYAYVADRGAGLRIINVADPAHPSEVGFYDTPGGALGVAVSGSYAYVADGGAGLRIINVADPARPTGVGFYDTLGDARSVAVSGSYAYVADGDGGLVILRFTGGIGTPEVSTLTPEPSREDPLHKVVLRGQVNPKQGSVQVWFEWGRDPNLATYQVTGTQIVAGDVRTVTATLSLPVTDSIGVLYYYRIAAGDPANPKRGDPQPFLILLGKPNQGGVTNRPYWNKFDRLIHYYAHDKDIAPTVIKAIIVHESAWAYITNKKPERTSLYELVNVDWKLIHRKGSTPQVPVTLTAYLLPNHPGEPRYNHLRNADVTIRDNTKYSDMVGACWITSTQAYASTHCTTWREIWPDSPLSWPNERRYYELLYEITNSEPPSDKEDKNKITPTVAQYRLASSYGLGHILYWYHYKDRIPRVLNRSTPPPPEDLWDPEINILVAVDYLRERRDACSSAGEQDYGDITKWEDVVRAYNGGQCGIGRGNNRHRVTKYFNSVKNYFTYVQPFLAHRENLPNLEVLAAGILAPTRQTTLAAQGSLLQAGEYEVDRLVADLKGTGQAQLATLIAVVSDPNQGVAYGLLRIFRDAAGTALEWESPPMEGVLASGVILTSTVPGGGAPLIVAYWGAGAHGTRAYLFRWDGQSFRPIRGKAEDGTEFTDFFGDAGVDIGPEGAWTGSRDETEPLGVLHFDHYSWNPSEERFEWIGKSSINLREFHIYLPLVLRNYR